MANESTTLMRWNPALGAWPERQGAHFRVWAPAVKTLEVFVSRAGSDLKRPLQAEPNGYFSVWMPDVRPGDQYRYRINEDGLYPDPASRFQPEGVHGPSMIVDPTAFTWTDAAWKGHAADELVFYELHVGTFSPEGTFQGARARLPELVQLGINAIELMPVADFPGSRNWGYDGVALFAPARCYGTPDELRALVNDAHRLGLSVFLDVVYNHLGPDGNYTGLYSPYYFTDRHRSPWGDGVNLDGEYSQPVRDHFIENALYWIHEFHIDGLRLDATHAMVDESAKHFLAELAERVHEAASRPIVIIAEDHRNLNVMVRSRAQGGWGLDGVWADDFHHEVRRFLTGDHEGYFAEFSGTLADLAATIRRGWFRNTDPTGLPYSRFVVCIQNHDQIGNRAMGDRLHHKIDLATYRAISALFLLCPETPLLFMGQEWAATSPFLFFADHHPELGRLVTEGRREEFKHFSAFRDPQTRDTIPDPQAESSFRACQLRWEERQEPSHQGVLKLYEALLKLRRTEPALIAQDRAGVDAEALDESTLALVRRQGTETLLLVARLRGQGSVDLANTRLAESLRGHQWKAMLTTEDRDFAVDGQMPNLQLEGDAPAIQFARPSAVLLRGTRG